MAITQTQLIAFLRRHRLAVEATIHADGSPQAAVVGVAVTDALELIFDTVDTSRKARNLARDPRVALVIGWDAEQTVQYEGVAERLGGDELKRCQSVYFAAFPDGPKRLAWPGIMYVRVRPTWIRFSDFSTSPPTIDELSGDALAR